MSVNLAIIGQYNLRTYYYLYALYQAKIPLKKVFLFGQKYFPSSPKNSMSLGTFTLDFTVSFSFLLTYFSAIHIANKSINDVILSLDAEEDTHYLVSAKGRINFLAVKHLPLWHIHPGKLPYYRGSTTFYYSLLQEQKVGCTLFNLDEGLDTGSVLLTIEHAQSECCHLAIDQLDHLIRAKCLMQALVQFKGKQLIAVDQTESVARYYYKIHPVLRHLAQRQLT